MIKTGDRVFYNGIYGTVDVVVSRDPISPPINIHGDDGKYYSAYGFEVTVISDDRDQGQGSTNDQRSI